MVCGSVRRLLLDIRCSVVQYRCLPLSSIAIAGLLEGVPLTSAPLFTMAVKLRLMSIRLVVSSGQPDISYPSFKDIA